MKSVFTIIFFALALLVVVEGQTTGVIGVTTSIVGVTTGGTGTTGDATTGGTGTTGDTTTGGATTGIVPSLGITQLPSFAVTAPPTPSPPRPGSGLTIPPILARCRGVANYRQVMLILADALLQRGGRFIPVEGEPIPRISRVEDILDLYIPDPNLSALTDWLGASRSQIVNFVGNAFNFFLSRYGFNFRLIRPDRETGARVLRIGGGATATLTPVILTNFTRERLVWAFNGTLCWSVQEFQYMVVINGTGGSYRGSYAAQLSPPTSGPLIGATAVATPGEVLSYGFFVLRPLNPPGTSRIVVYFQSDSPGILLEGGRKLDTYYQLRNDPLGVGRAYSTQHLVIAGAGTLTQTKTYVARRVFTFP
jgi:hypothetical protein